MKKLFLTLLAAVIITALAATGSVSAQSSASAAGSDGSAIWSGLLSGFGLSQPKPTGPPTTSAASTPKSVQPATSTKTYAALGDSVAAGLGLPASASPKGNDTACGRSPYAYGNIVGRRMHMPLVHAACSGATVGDLFTKQAVTGPNYTAQLDIAFASGTPGLITVTAGANDAHWTGFIRSCYVTNCSNQATTLAANAWLVILQGKLHAAFTDIYLRSGGNPPTVVMTGYYNPLSQSCTRLQSNITSEEITWLSSETKALNQTIQDVAAQYSFVRFAPVSFAGHDICSSSPWVQGLADNAPFHPKAPGQRAIANSVLRTLSQ